MDRIKALDKLGEIKIVGENIVKVSDKKPIKSKKLKSMNTFTMISYLKEMGLYLLDTYFVVLMAAQEICNSNYVMREENLVKELHEAIKTLHSDSHILQLQSCFKETI